MTLQIPKPWLEVLEQLQDNFPGAVIAGGALRDLTFGLPQKDVDMFFYASQATNVDTILREKFPGVVRAGEPYPKGTFAGELNAVYNYDEDGVRYQFIWLNTPFSLAELLGKFDWGLDMIGTTSAEGVYFDPRFELDQLNRRFTLYNDKAYQKSVDRYARLAGKYNDWPACLPYVPGFHAYVIASSPSEVRDEEIPF